MSDTKDRIIFTEWPGGEAAPADAPGDTRVIVMYDDGSTSKIRRAGDLRWRREGLCDDIVGYYVVKFEEVE